MPNLQVPRYLLRSSCTEASSLHRHCPASSVLRASPPPSSARPYRHRPPVGRPRPRHGLPVARALSLCTCCRHYPGTAAGGTALLIRPAISTFPEDVIGSAYASSFSRLAQRSLALRPAHSRCHQFVARYPKASDISSPPCLLQLLPAGAVAGWDLHPLESAAVSRRTPRAGVGARGFNTA